MTTKVLLAIFAGVLLVGAISQVFYDSEPQVKASSNAPIVSPAARMNTLPVPTRSDVSRPSSDSAAVRPPIPQTTLLQDLATSTNYKKVYEDAKASPGKGGFFVAGLVNRRCSDARLAIMKSTEIAAAKPHAEAYKIQAASDRLAMLCQGMIDDDVDIYKGYANIFKTQDRRADPILSIKEDFSEAYAKGDMKPVAEGLKAALSFSSPELLESLSFTTKGQEYYFNGKTYSPGYKGSANILLAARMLAVCEIWSRCGSATDYHLLNACASAGICTSSYEQLAAAVLSPEGLIEAHQLAKLISNAAATGDVSVYIPGP